MLCLFADDSGTQLLVLNVNGMDVALRGDKVHEILDMIDACCREALGRGYFPYGSDEASVAPEAPALTTASTGKQRQQQLEHKKE